MPILDYDAVALQRHPKLKGFSFSWTMSKRYETPEAQRLVDLITSRAGVTAMVGAAIAAPNKPVVVALEDLLMSEMGDAAFTPNNKQNIGRIAKAVLIQLGAEHTRTGVPVTVTSHFSKGSTYAFPGYLRRPMQRDKDVLVSEQTAGN